MSSEMIYERLMAAKHKIKYDKFSLNSLTDSEIELITKDTDKLKQDNNFIVIDDVLQCRIYLQYDYREQTKPSCCRLCANHINYCQI